MLIRIWCKTHKAHAENVGNGNILYPTSSGDGPVATYRGWYELDASEFACSSDPDHPGECNLVWQIQSD